MTLQAKPFQLTSPISASRALTSFTEPKTPKSTRVVAIPESLCEKLKTYLDKLYDKKEGARIFPVTKHYLWHEIDRGCKASGMKRIRVHDLRHSHASLLIEMGFSPLLIAERLGHENIEPTLNTYSHLYPHKLAELTKKLENIGFKHHTSIIDKAKSSQSLANKGFVSFFQLFPLDFYIF